ncbi:site-specific DNA-methyltransferase [Acinetobacter radioresistens]|uniref:site-specific DNA-methyltransferase n=1 Tax=Acinetobacter radioresistens TaxID=40216 RepID=UPI002FCDDA02
MGKQKLELSWIGKDKRPRLEPRILIEKSSLSYHAKNKVSENDLFDSKLIFGDNLLALKALEKDYAGKVKCIYIDPPYNTGNAFEYYDDGLEHSIWLGLIRDRLEVLKNLLSVDGVIFVQIDDVEQAYLRVLMDEVFGRSNFINTISVNLKNVAGASGGGEDKKLKKNIEYIHLYTKDYLNFNSFKGVYDYIPISELVENYRQEDKSWKYTTILIYEGDKEYLGSTVDGDGNEIKIFTRKNPIIKSINQIIREENLSEAEAYDKYASKIFQTQMPQSSIRPRVMEKAIELGSKEDLHSIEYIPKTGRNKGTVYEQYYKGGNFRLLAWLSDVSEEKNGVLCKKEAQGTYWDFVGHTKNLSKEGAVTFPNGKKPEALIQRILEMSTEPGDLVLDSFAGSGTTGAVAHKMGRRWIMVELGEHCHTHIIPRLQKVIDGEDKGGVTESTGWQGGGGFRYYKLAPSLMKKDQWDNWVINPEYNQEMLVEAMCKLEGYTYTPSETEYWNHGKGSETDFIYVTTQTLTDQQLQAISEEVGEGRTLLIIASAWRSKNIDRFINLTLKKIPNSIIKACEWGHDDYSLNVQNLPMSEPDIEEKPKAKKVKNTQEQSQVTGDLFGDQT